MPEPTEQPADELLAQLARAADGLLVPSETDAPFEPVRWGMTPPTPEALRIHAGRPETAPVEEWSLDEFLGPLAKIEPWHSDARRARAQRFGTLRELIAERLEEPCVYRVGTVEIAVYLLGRATTGEYLGLRTLVVRT